MVATLLKSLENSLPGVRVEMDHFFLLHGIPGEDFYLHLRDSLLFENHIKVLIPEIRPYLYGSKILAARLLKEDITPTIITDNMMGLFFYKGLVKKVYLFFKKARPDGLLAYPGATLVAILSRYHNVEIGILQGKEEVSEVLLDKDSSTLLGNRILFEGIEALRIEDEVVPWELIGRGTYP